MSKKPSKKKIVIAKKEGKTTAKKSITPTVSRRSTAAATIQKDELIFGKQNYMLMALGLALVFLGLFLMTGGNMPSPDVWDEDIIYGFRRTVLAPFVILAGLVVEIFAIFKD